MSRASTRMTKPSASGAPAAASFPLQRKCACAHGAGASGSCEGCRQKQLQRAVSGPRAPREAPELVYEVLRSAGHPLDPATRAFFEQRMPGTSASGAAPSGVHGKLSISEPGDAGEREADRLADRIARMPADAPERVPAGFDFGRVRIHTDARAAASARAVEARAYTVGHDIVFAEGQFAPGTAQGRALLAHELVHTAQQAPVLARQPADPTARQLPAHVPKAPSLRSAAAGGSTVPCSTTGCPPKIPGSAQDFSPDGGKAGVAQLSDPHASVEVKKFAAAEAPEFLAGVHDITVSSGKVMDEQGVSWSDCAQAPADDPSAGCILVSVKQEQQARVFNEGTAATIGGQSRDAWSFALKRRLSWASDQIRFRRSPTPGLPAGNATAMWELHSLHSWLAGFPVDYARAMAEPTPEAQQARLTEFLDFRVESQTLGVRGMLTRLRCALPCAEVNESITRVFGEVTSGWPREVRDALLFGLMDPARALSWPPGPGVPMTLTFPPDPRPKPKPLYVPRGGFEAEAGKTGENL